MAEVERLGPWYHSYELADWLNIEGEHRGHEILPLIDDLGFPADFSGQSVLDVACNSGFYSFVARARGATSALGIELFPRAVEQARFIEGLLGLDVEFVVEDVHNVDSSRGTFDTIICSGLLYHIPDPTNVLQSLAAVCTGTLLVECEFLLEPELTSMARFIEGTYRKDQTNWWIYGPECMEGMVRAAGSRPPNSRGSTSRPRAKSVPRASPWGGGDC